MAKVFSIGKFKFEKKDGELDPLTLVEMILDLIISNPHEVEKIAIVTVDVDGVIKTSSSAMNHLELIGLHQAAQHYAVRGMDLDE